MEDRWLSGCRAAEAGPSSGAFLQTGPPFSSPPGRRAGRKCSMQAPPAMGTLVRALCAQGAFRRELQYLAGPARARIASGPVKSLAALAGPKAAAKRGSECLVASGSAFAGFRKLG